MPVRFYAENGSERDLSWAEDMHGTQAIHDPGVLPVTAPTALHAASGEEQVLSTDERCSELLARLDRIIDLLQQGRPG